MNLSNSFFALIVVIAGVVTALALWPPREPAPAAPTADLVTIAGCLRAGDGEGAFMLVTDDARIYQVRGAEALALASHLNHRVELTGDENRTEAALLFLAASLTMVAPS